MHGQNRIKLFTESTLCKNGTPVFFLRAIDFPPL